MRARGRAIDGSSFIHVMANLRGDCDRWAAEPRLVSPRRRKIAPPPKPRDRLHNPVTATYKLVPDAAVRHVSRVGTVLNAQVSPSGFPALVLNADFRPLSYYPLSLWSWQDAIKAVFLDRVNIVANYDRAVHSPSLEMKLPSVVSLKTYVKPSTHPAFTRFNVFLRDRFACQYCGARDDLTFDHLLPRSRGGHTTWSNVVAACSPCNLRKGNLTPDESKMWPSQRPFQPSVQHLHRNGRLFPAQLPARQLARLSLLGHRTRSVIVVGSALGGRECAQPQRPGADQACASR